MLLAKGGTECDLDLVIIRKFQIIGLLVRTTQVIIPHLIGADQKGIKELVQFMHPAQGSELCHLVFLLGKPQRMGTFQRVNIHIGTKRIPDHPIGFTHGFEKLCQCIIGDDAAIVVTIPKSENTDIYFRHNHSPFLSIFR